MVNHIYLGVSINKITLQIQFKANVVFKSAIICVDNFDRFSARILAQNVFILCDDQPLSVWLLLMILTLQN